MSVENYFLSREGRNLSNKILNLIGSLVIKMKPELDEEETAGTFKEWLKYKHAYEGNDDIYQYEDEYDRRDTLAAGIPNITSTAKKMLSPDDCFKLYLNNDPDYFKLMNYLRRKRINSYVERNSYVYQFQGKPRKGQEIYIKNRDDPNGPDIPIDKLKISLYPQTYQAIFIDGLIDDIKKAHPDYLYLNYLIESISIYRVRNADNFEILDYDSSSFSTSELDNFFKCYQRNRIYMDKMMLIDGFQYSSRMPQYPFLLEMLLLQASFSDFFNSFMDNYALANYTDQEIYDILDSYNLSSLKKVSINILRKIIREIPDFLELRGSDLVIEKILEKVADESVTIKRYYLVKIFKTNESGQTSFDTNSTYENNVDLAFKEKIIHQGSGSTEENLIDYDSFTESDQIWGGNLAELNEETKEKVRNAFKKEIIQLDFSNILTKYLTISATVDSYMKQLEMHDKLGLLWQYLQRTNSNFLINDTITFDSFQIRPIDIYAAICWFHAYFNGAEDPDLINIKNFNIGNIMKLQDTGIASLVGGITGNNLMENDPDYVPPATLSLPAGLGDKTIEQILGGQTTEGQNTNPDDEIWPKYLVTNPGSENYGKNLMNYESVFVNFTPNATLSQIFSEYDKNATIINALKKKWMNSNSLEEARAWEYLIQQNRTNTLFEIMFNPYERFSDFIKTSSKDFYQYLSLTIDNEESSIDSIFDLYIKLTEKFKEYILQATENVISLSVPNGDTSTNSVDYLNDLKLMIQEFVSIYTELHKIEYTQTLNDEPYNRLKLLYSFGADIFYDSLTETDIKKIKYERYLDIKTDKFQYRMLPHEQKEDFESLIKSIKQYLENIDEYNERLNKVAIQNILSYVNERIDKLNKRKELSTSHTLTPELQNLMNVLERIKEVLENNEIISYLDLFNIQFGDYSGKTVLYDFGLEEIDRITNLINEISKDKNILPNFEYVVSDMLYEYYKESIALVILSKDGEVVSRLDTEEGDTRIEQLYHKIYADTLYIDESEYLRLKDDYNKMINIIYDSYKDSIELNHIGLEYDISFTTFIEEYIKLIYEQIYEEFGFDHSDVLKLNEKLGETKDIICEFYKEYMELNHIGFEEDISFTIPLEDFINLTYKKYKESVDDKRMEKLSFKYQMIDDVVAVSASDKIDLSDSISE